MTSNLFPQYSREDLFQWLQRTIKSWRLLPQLQIQRIDYNSRHEMSQWQKADAEAALAHTRIEHLAAIAQRGWAKSTILAVEALVLFIGALAFNALPTFLAKSLERGSLSKGIGFLIGASLAWLTHDRAVRGLSKLRRRHDSRQALQMLVQEQQNAPVQNELAQQFYASQQSCLRQVEAENLQGQFWLDLLIAIAASLLEGFAVFHQVSQSVPQNQAILTSILPVVLIWLAALQQSDRADFAQDCTKLIHTYQDFLPDGNISEAQALRLYELDAVFKHFTAAAPSDIRTVKGIRAKASSEFAQTRVEQLEAEGIQAIEERSERLRQTRKQLPSQFPTPQGFDVAGYLKSEIPPEQQKACQDNAQQIAQEEARLKAEAEEDLEMIRVKYWHQIQKWQRVKNEADRIMQDEK